MEVDIKTSATRFSKKRKASTASTHPPKKKKTTTKPLGPSGGPRGFYGLNQGNHGKELKDVDTDISALSFTTTGSVTLLNGVAQGTDFTNRVGRKFNTKSILIRMVITSGSTATANHIARWMIVYDKQVNGSLPAVTDILTSASISAPNNLNNRDRFVVILDKQHNIGATGANDNAKVFMKKYRRCHLETTNGGTAATIGSIQTGGLYFVAVGSAAAGTTAPIFDSGICRIRFTDD